MARLESLMREGRGKRRAGPDAQKTEQREREGGENLEAKGVSVWVWILSGQGGLGSKLRALEPVGRPRLGAEKLYGKRRTVEPVAAAAASQQWASKVTDQ